jgi:GAF domain-containing protein
MTSLLGVPIFVRGELVGDLYLSDKIGKPEFSEEDEWLLQLLAVHAATALTNAHLLAENLSALEEAGRERTRAQVLLRVTQTMSRSVHLDEVIPVILNSAMELTGAVGAAIFLLEAPPPQHSSEGHALGAPDPQRGEGWEGQEGQAMQEEQEGQESYVAARYAIGLSEVPEGYVHLPVSNSVSGRAIGTGQTQVVPNMDEERAIVFSRLAGERVLRSLVMVPLRTPDSSGGKHTLGVLSVYSDRVNAFDGSAVELAEAFGAQASAALNNSQLYEQAERGRRAAEREQQRLLEVEQMKDEFLSTAAHELRTPLTSIHMSAGLMQEQLVLLAGRIESAEGKRLRSQGIKFDPGC